jgi:hypothetical protein
VIAAGLLGARPALDFAQRFPAERRHGAQVLGSGEKMGLRFGNAPGRSMPPLVSRTRQSESGRAIGCGC